MSTLLPMTIGALGAVLSLVIGYFLGIARDRHKSIDAQKIEATNRLYDRVLEIERKELSDGKNTTLAVQLSPKTDPKQILSPEEASYQHQLGIWRQSLQKEENRARLWVDSSTISTIRSYFILMMLCKSWEDFGQGNLIENEIFLRNLRDIFGSRTEKIIEAVTIKHSQTGEPWLLECGRLSSICLNNIQRRLSREIASPAYFRLRRLPSRWFGRRS